MKTNRTPAKKRPRYVLNAVGPRCFQLRRGNWDQRCTSCPRAPLMTRRLTTRKHPYRMGDVFGVKGADIELVSIYVYKCPRCGEQTPVFPCMGPLIDRLAEAISKVKHRPLTQGEAQYLRKWVRARFDGGDRDLRKYAKEWTVEKMP